MSVTTFTPGQWGASDATLGVTGFTIENFEDVTLAPGLTVSRLNGGIGNFGATTSLPAGRVFNPAGDPGNWKDLEFGFGAGVTSVGFSVQQTDLADKQFLVNGVVVVPDLLALMGTDTETKNGFVGLYTFNSRQGNIRIDATGGDTISTIRLDNTAGDGFAIDHLAFNGQVETVPEPASLGLFALGLATLAARRRRQ